MNETERWKGWAMAWALIAAPMIWLAWVFTADALTHVAIAGWVVFCLGATWLTIWFNWHRQPSNDTEFPFADGLLRDPRRRSPDSPPPHQS